jgi:hypothetical protein
MAAVFIGSNGTRDMAAILRSDCGKPKRDVLGEFRGYFPVRRRRAISSMAGTNADNDAGSGALSAAPVTEALGDPGASPPFANAVPK